MVWKTGLRTGVKSTIVEMSKERNNPLLGSFIKQMEGLEQFELPRPYKSLKPHISRVMTEDEYAALGVIAALIEAGKIEGLENYLDEISDRSDFFLYHVRFIDIYLRTVRGTGKSGENLYDEVHSLHMSIRLNEEIQTAMNGMEDMIEQEEFDGIRFTFFPILFNEIFIFRLKALILPSEANMLRLVQTMHIAETYVRKKKIRQAYLPRFLNDLSVAYSFIGAIDTAIDYGEQVIKIFAERDHIAKEEFHQILIICLNLASIYVWTGSPEKIDSLKEFMDQPNLDITRHDRELAKEILLVRQKGVPSLHDNVLEVYRSLLGHLNSFPPLLIRPGLVYFMIFQLILEAWLHDDGKLLKMAIDYLSKAVENENNQTYVLRGELSIFLAGRFQKSMGNKTLRQQSMILNDDLFEFITLPRFEFLEFTLYRTILISLYISSIVSHHHTDIPDVLSRAVRLYDFLEAKADQYRMTQALELHYNLNRLLALIYFLLHQDKRSEAHLARAQQMTSGQFPRDITELNPRAMIEEDREEYAKWRIEALDELLKNDNVQNIYERFVLKRRDGREIDLQKALFQNSPIGQTKKRQWEELNLNPPTDLPREKEETQQTGKQELELEIAQPYGFWTAFTEWEADVLKKIRFLLWTGRFKDVERLIIMLLSTEIRDIMRFQLLVMKILNDYLMWQSHNEFKDNTDEFWEAIEIWEKLTEAEKYLFLGSRNLVLFRKAFGYETNEEIFGRQENEKLISWMGEELHFDLVALLIIKFFFDKERGIINKDIVELLGSLDENELNPIDYYNILVMKLEIVETDKEKEAMLDLINETAEKYGFRYVADDEDVDPIFF